MASLEEFAPLPDEHIFSIAARYQRRTGCIGARHTSDKLFGNLDDHRKEKSHIWDNFFSCLGVHSLTEKLDYMYKTTLLPLDCLWRHKESVVRVNKDSLYRNDNPLGKFGYRFCTDCVSSDIETYGVAYWHRTHQAEGVVACPIHRTTLRAKSCCANNKLGGATKFELPSDMVHNPGDSVAVVSDETRSELSWIIERHADFSSVLLNIDRRLVEQGCWKVIKDELANRHYNCLVALEQGVFYEAWQPYVEGLKRLGSGCTLDICSQQQAHGILVGSHSFSNGATLLAFLFEKPERFCDALSSMDPQLGRLNEIDRFTLQKISSWIEAGKSTYEIARRMSIEAIDAWAIIRLNHLVPNEVTHWLTDSRVDNIEALILDNYELETVACQLSIGDKDLSRLIIKTVRLRKAYRRAKKTGLMARYKIRILDIAISEGPCKYEYIRTLEPDLCEWVEHRDKSWVQSFKLTLKYLYNMRYKDYFKAKFIGRCKALRELEEQPEQLC
ncbi:MAG: TniQ family protein [Gammaproteobacteria bacterium]|nr:TniQ family protein [Gammaproteobacteria bacterium]